MPNSVTMIFMPKVLQLRQLSASMTNMAGNSYLIFLKIGSRMKVNSTLFNNFSLLWPSSNMGTKKGIRFVRFHLAIIKCPQGAGMVRWWKRSPPASMAWVQFPDMDFSFSILFGNAFQTRPGVRKTVPLVVCFSNREESRLESYHL